MYCGGVSAEERGGPGAQSGVTSGLAGAAVFVGRETELHDIATSLEAAASGQAQFLLALGEPGAGKTRLATEAEQRAAGFRCVWGRAWDDEGAPPLWPWTSRPVPLSARSRGAPRR